MERTGDYTAGSYVGAGNDVVISAGRDVIVETGRDITIEGGRIYGGRDVVLDAGRDLTITSAQNSGSSNYSGGGGGGGGGLKAGYGSGGAAFGVNVSAQAGGSGFKDQYASHSNALIVAGDTLYTSSGRDTTIAGAHLEGDRVWMDVGNNLTVSSLQDHTTRKKILYYI